MTMTSLVRTGVGLAVLLAASSASAQRGAAAPNVFRGDGLLLTQGPGSHIGVTVRDIESTDAAAATGGVVVTEVRPETPAATAGLRVSDTIIEFDGERVRSIRQFARLVQETPPGRQVRATIMRDGRREELNITPAEPARTGALGLDPQGRPFTFNDDRMRELMDSATRLKMAPFGAPRLGVTVQEMTTDLATYFGAKEGVLVSSVTEGSAAARAGIRAGDVITSAAGQPVRSQADLSQALRNATGTVALGIVRDKQSITVNVDVVTTVRPTLQLRRGQVI